MPGLFEGSASPPDRRRQEEIGKTGFDLEGVLFHARSPGSDAETTGVFGNCCVGVPVEELALVHLD